MFTELATDVEYLKVAFTKADGTTELYAEKEFFSGVSQYPTAYTDDYVKATTVWETNAAHRATNPARSLTGDRAGDEWASNVVTNQRFHIDLGSAKIINKIYYENSHDSGGDTDRGVQNFTFQGSNTGAGTFDDLVYANDGGWTTLDVSTNVMLEHTASDEADPQYITVTNTTAYRYYALKFADNYGDVNFMGVRRIELQAGKAIYHVSRDGWTINDDTSIYMYYDAGHGDNTDFIGAVNTAAGEKVWNANYVSVFHMADASGGIIDSTDNSEDASEGGDPTYAQTGQVGNCILFDGSGDYFDVANDYGIFNTHDHTIETWMKGTSYADNDVIIGMLGEANVKIQVSGSDITVTKYGADEGFHNITLKASAPTGEWHYYAASYDYGGAGTVGYYDDTSPDTDAYSGEITDPTIDSYIGGQSGATRWFDGNLDEIRFSDNIRSTAWLKGTYNSGNDSLFTYGSEEEAPAVEANVIFFGANF